MERTTGLRQMALYSPSLPSLPTAPCHLVEQNWVGDRVTDCAHGQCVEWRDVRVTGADSSDGNDVHRPGLWNVTQPR